MIKRRGTVRSLVADRLNELIEEKEREYVEQSSQIDADADSKIDNLRMEGLKVEQERKSKKESLAANLADEIIYGKNRAK